MKAPHDECLIMLTHSKSSLTRERLGFLAKLRGTLGLLVRLRLVTVSLNFLKVEAVLLLSRQTSL